MTFDSVRRCDDQDALRKGCETLPENLQDTSGREGGGIPLYRTKLSGLPIDMVRMVEGIQISIRDSLGRHIA